MKSNGSILMAACLSILVSAAAAAQAPGAAPAGSGYLVLGMDQRIGGADVAPAQRQQALSIAARLREVLQRDPAVAQPAGFSVRMQRAYGRRTDWADFDSGLPYYAGIYGTFFAADVKPSPTHFGNPDFGVYANTVLQCPMQQFTSPWASGTPWSLGDLPVLQGGRRTGEVHGYPVYDGQCVILSHSKEPAFRPLTHEEFLQLQLRDFKAKADKMHQQFSGQPLDPSVRDAIASADKVIQDEIAQLEQQISQMDPETRQAPAAVQEADLVSIDTEGAVPLSVPNPAFFNRSLPATQVQAIAVYLPFVQSEPRAAWLPAGLPTDWEPALQRIRDGLDWQALGALVQ